MTGTHNLIKRFIDSCEGFYEQAGQTEADSKHRPIIATANRLFQKPEQLDIGKLRNWRMQSDHGSPLQFAALLKRPSLSLFFRLIDDARNTQV